MSIFMIVSAAALFFGAIIGLGGLIWPKWAQNVVRLVPDPDFDKPGGYSEFRATYGGLFLMLHLTGLLIISQPDIPDMFKIFTVLPIAAAWVGAGFGRTLSLLLDPAENRRSGLIPVWMATEIGLGIMIAAPLFDVLLF